MNEDTTPKATSSLEMWLHYLENIHTSAIDLGLERVEKVAREGNLTRPAPKVITVAGTNGKGSTCAILEAILIDAGYSVGVYSSPHLIRYTERVRIGGMELDNALHCQAFEHINQLRADTSLSFFEFSTLAALWLFKQQQVDVVILEVGLGGRLDATNVVDHDVSVITSLAVDHVDWLGDDINVIGFEKAGIFRSGRPAICGQPDSPSTVAAHADDIGAELYQVGINYTYQESGERWSWRCGQFDLDDLPLPNLPLQNAATALTALGVSNLDITDVNVVNGLQNAKLNGRMQLLSTDPVVLLDVAHNPHSAQYLSTSLSKRYPGRYIRAVVGMLKDKDIDATLHALSGCVSEWHLATLSGERAADALQLTKTVSEFSSRYHTYDNAVAAYTDALKRSDSDDIIVVMGSFVTVGEILEFCTQGSLNGD
jgi:dihydrofolate synthase/folylpolyglutamate synthase